MPLRPPSSPLSLPLTPTHSHSLPLTTPHSHSSLIRASLLTRTHSHSLPLTPTHSLADLPKCRCARPHRLCHAVRSQMRTPLMQVCLCTAPILGTTSPPPPSRTLPAPANMRRGATCKLTPTFAPPACEQQQIIAVCPLAKPLHFFSPSLPLSLSPSLLLSLGCRCATRHSTIVLYCIEKLRSCTIGQVPVWGLWWRVVEWVILPRGAAPWTPPW